MDQLQLNLFRRSAPLCVWMMLTVELLSFFCKDVDSRRNVTWCLRSEEELLNLSCDSTSLIRIASVVHGWQNISQQSVGEEGCRAPDYDGCSDNYPNAVLLLDTCSGLETCVVSSLEMPASLSTCGANRSNYVTIEYDCISVINQTAGTDICGGAKNSWQLLTPVGYITSPNYPRRYDANAKCSCLLETGSEVDETKTLEVVLEILDFSISLVPNERAPYDWLRYGGVDSNWGDGKLIIGSSSIATGSSIPIYTGTNRIVLNFNSDEQLEGRGFWIMYYGVNTTSKERLPVGIKCGTYSPPETRRALSCFDPPRGGELYLSCNAYGVIYILRVSVGCRSVNQTVDLLTDTCLMDDVIDNAKCTNDVDIPEIGNQCMRRITCNPRAPSSFNMTECDRPNDFVLVEYQCVTDSSQGDHIIDVCGDDTEPGVPLTVSSGIGFISSPLYPSNYPPDCNCFCQLEVGSQSDAQIVFYVMDLRLRQTSADVAKNSDICFSTDSKSDCKGDWLDYGKAGQSAATRISLSSENVGEPVYTGTKAVLLNFHSDSEWEDRGFWLKYVGRSIQGSDSPVVVRCGHYKRQLTASNDGPNGGPTSGHSGDRNTTTGGTMPAVHHVTLPVAEGESVGLIVGLTILAACVAVVAFFVVWFLWQRSRKRASGLLSASKSASLSGGSLGGVERKEDDSIWMSGSGRAQQGQGGRRRLAPIPVFYNEAYKMQDPTLYREQRLSSSHRKRPLPGEETLHF